MLRLSGAVSTPGSKLSVLTVVKPRSTPGTAVLGWGVLTVDIRSHTLVNTLFEGRTLTPGEIIIAFVLYADTLLSINQVAQLFEAVYDTVHTTIREVEAAFGSGFHLIWSELHEDGDSPTQINETGQKCSGFKG